MLVHFSSPQFYWYVNLAGNWTEQTESVTCMYVSTWRSNTQNKSALVLWLDSPWYNWWTFVSYWLVTIQTTTTTNPHTPTTQTPPPPQKKKKNHNKNPSECMSAESQLGSRGYAPPTLVPQMLCYSFPLTEMKRSCVLKWMHVKKTTVVQ